MFRTSKSDIRTTISDNEVSGFCATIGAQRNSAMIAFLSVWLAGWAIGELVVLSWIVIVPALIIGWWLGLVPYALVAKLVEWAEANWGEILLVGFVWLPFWTIAGILVFRALRWQLGGREVIVIHEGALEVRREAALSRRSQAFDLARVRNLRYAARAIDLRADVLDQEVVSEHAGNARSRGGVDRVRS